MKKSAFFLAEMLVVASVVTSQNNRTPLVAEDSDGQIFFDAANDMRRLVSNDYGTLSLDDFAYKRALIDSLDDYSVRRSYDEQMRLVSKECWTIGATAKQSVLSRIEEYSYYEDSVVCCKSSIKDLKKKQLEETQFDRMGLASVRKVYAFETKKGNLENTSYWKYDDKKRIIEHEKIEYSGDKKKTRKDVFSYDSLGEKNGYTFYEDGAIRLKRIYSTADTYKETTYFDSGFSVETSYEKGVKVSSTLYLNGRAQNRTNYAEE